MLIESDNCCSVSVGRSSRSCPVPEFACCFCGEKFGNGVGISSVALSDFSFRACFVFVGDVAPLVVVDVAILFLRRVNFVFVTGALSVGVVGLVDGSAAGGGGDGLSACDATGVAGGDDAGLSTSTSTCSFACNCLFASLWMADILVACLPPSLVNLSSSLCFGVVWSITSHSRTLLTRWRLLELSFTGSGWFRLPWIPPATGLPAELDSS